MAHGRSVSTSATSARAPKTGTAAAQVLSASTELSSEADRLRTDVHLFIADVKAA